MPTQNQTEELHTSYTVPKKSIFRDITRNIAGKARYYEEYFEQYFVFLLYFLDSVEH